MMKDVLMFNTHVLWITHRKNTMTDCIALPFAAEAGEFSDEEGA